jgi:hypothetical protein
VSARRRQKLRRPSSSPRQEPSLRWTARQRARRESLDRPSPRSRPRSSPPPSISNDDATSGPNAAREILERGGRKEGVDQVPVHARIVRRRRRRRLAVLAKWVALLASLQLRRGGGGGERGVWDRSRGCGQCAPRPTDDNDDTCGISAHCVCATCLEVGGGGNEALRC